MLTLTLRTDKPEAEVGLYDNLHQLAYISWLAHRELAETLHYKLKAILDENSKSWNEVSAIAIYAGPGSFTGLRIGFSVADTLAASLNIPIVATKGEQWISKAIAELSINSSYEQVLPEYGSLPHITKPKR